MGKAISIVGEPRHVANLTPPFSKEPVLAVASVVIGKGIETAAADEDLDAVVEERAEDGTAYRITQTPSDKDVKGAA